MALVYNFKISLPHTLGHARAPIATVMELIFGLIGITRQGLLYTKCMLAVWIIWHSVDAAVVVMNSKKSWPWKYSLTASGAYNMTEPLSRFGICGSPVTKHSHKNVPMVKIHQRHTYMPSSVHVNRQEMTTMVWEKNYLNKLLPYWNFKRRYCGNQRNIKRFFSGWESYKAPPN